MPTPNLPSNLPLRHPFPSDRPRAAVDGFVDAAAGTAAGEAPRGAAALDGYTAPPTEVQNEELAALTTQVANLESTWKQTLSQDVAEFDRSLSSSGIGFITVAGAR